MYYLELIQKFWDFNQKERLSTTAIAMYLYLLKLGNDRGSYNITITDMALAEILSITRKTVRPTKEKLRSLGLLEFENKRGLPCSYRLFLDYPLQIMETEKDVKSSKDRRSPNHINEKKEGLSLLDNIREISDDKVKEPPKYFNPDNNPSWEEFLEYAQSLEGYDISLESDIKIKYFSWRNNDWKNAANRPISNWMSSLKSILPYMGTKDDPKALSIEAISKIKRPKS